MEKIDYEAPELLELDSILAVSGDSKCGDGKVEEFNEECPNDANA